MESYWHGCGPSKDAPKVRGEACSTQTPEALHPSRPALNCLSVLTPTGPPPPHRHQDAAIGRPQRAQPVLPQSASIHRLRALKGTQAPPAREGPSSPSPPTASAPAHLIHHLPTVPLLPLDLLANGEITAASSALGGFAPALLSPSPPGGHDI